MNTQNPPLNPNKTRKSNPFISLNSSQDRLNSWKELRRDIGESDDATALQLVAEYWGNAPLSNFSYNPMSPDEWATPWEMVSRGDWCRDMVAVAMEFTLRLAGWSADRMKLVYVRDYNISEELLLLKIDDKIALNYIINEVIEYPNTDQVITGCWGHDGKNYISKAY